MAGFKRQAQRIGGVKTYTAHRDFSDICPPCGGYIGRGDFYVLKAGRPWHLACKDLKDPLAQPKPKPPPAQAAGPQKMTKKQTKKQRRAERRQREEARKRQLASSYRARAEVMKQFDFAINGDD